MVTAVRRRVSWDTRGRRGRKQDLAWAHRLLLPRGYDTLCARGRAGLKTVLAADDPTNEIGTAWGVKEQLRRLLACPSVEAAQRERATLNRYVALAAMPETIKAALERGLQSEENAPRNAGNPPTTAAPDPASSRDKSPRTGSRPSPNSPWPTPTGSSPTYEHRPAPYTESFDRLWLAEQTPAFRDAVQVVVIDTSAPYASGIRAALPGARVAVDKWRLVALANQVVTEVRQRVTRELLGRRGTTAEKIWVNRRLLLTGYEHLSTKQRARLKATRAAENPTGEIGAAWGVKERLRMLLAETDEHRIRHRLYLFYRDAPSRHARDDLAGAHHRDLVARGPHRPDDGSHRRPHRGLQPDHQADQARRLRLPQPRELPAPDTLNHRGHPSTTRRRMTRHPAESRRAGLSLRAAAAAGRPATM